MPVFELSYFWSAGMFVNLALLFYVLGFLARDELWLRGLLLTGTGFYLLYYYHAAESPLWDAIFTSSVLGLANLCMIVVIMVERTTVTMSGETVAIFRAFKTLNPGQFRRLMKRAVWRQCETATTLSRENVVPEGLYYVMSGRIDIARGETRSELETGAFVAEIAFLLNRPATATVIAQPGTRYLEWKPDDIRRLMRRSQDMSNAMIALFNNDLARKVARSMPHPETMAARGQG